MTVNKSFQYSLFVPLQPVAIHPKYDLFQGLQVGPFIYASVNGAPVPVVPRALIPYGDAISERFALDRAFAIASCKDLKNDPFLAGMDIEVVEDAPSSLRQITLEEYRAMKALYEEIAAGRTPLKVERKEPFRSQFLGSVKKLMERPSGRAIIISICRSAYPIDILEGEFSKCFPPNSNRRVHMTLNLKNTFSFACFTHGEEWRFLSSGNHISLAHEGIHLLHFLHFFNCHPTDCHAAMEMGRLPYPDPNYTNIMEWFAICGNAPYGELMVDIPGCGLICENLVRHEFDEPLRYGHIASGFPPFKEEDKPKIHERSAINSCTRIEEAAYYGMYDEVKTLLDHGADPQAGLRAAVRGSVSKVINLCLDRGASFPVSQ